MPGVRGLKTMSDANAAVRAKLVGCVMAGTAVALGAWAAHGLADVLVGVYGDATKQEFGREITAVEKYVGDFRTGVTYQMWHALAVLATASWTGKLATIGRRLLVAGSLIFSGSLYILALSGVTKWGAVTPIGGLLLLVGWSVLSVAAIKSKNGDAVQSTA